MRMHACLYVYVCVCKYLCACVSFLWCVCVYGEGADVIIYAQHNVFNTVRE